MVKLTPILTRFGLLACLTIAVTITTAATAVYAKDFGKYGVTTEIKEEGFLGQIARKLKSVDMDKEQKKMQILAQKRINEPLPVAGIVRTTKAQSYSFDPTYILQEDIRLPCGMLLYPKGTKVNPLDHMDLERKMIFIDSRDKAQESWLKTLIAEHYGSEGGNEHESKGSREELVIILTGGRPLELQDRLKYAVYFDQGGFISKGLGIKQVPAVVTQEDKLLRINEIYLESRYDRQ